MNLRAWLRISAFGFVLAATASLWAQQPAAGGRRAQGPEAELVRQAGQLDHEGKYEEAREVLKKAADQAGSPAGKARVQRALAMSWAFAGDCRQTGEAEQSVIDYWKTREAEEPGNAFFQQGEMANEAARVCIDLGDLSAAERWYRTGTELGKKEPNISADRQALWDFRLQHALGRLAARKGNKAEAAKYVAEAKATLEKMTELRNQQEVFLPYLTGYVSFYLGDAKAALVDLQKANERDAFIQTLIGEVYVQLGDKAQAMAYYTKAAANRGHNPPAAYAHRVAKKAIL